MHRRDVIDVQAQVPGAVVAGSRLGRHPLDADVFQGFHEVTTRDPQVDRPDVLEVESQHCLQIRRIQDPIELSLRPSPSR